MTGFEQSESRAMRNGSVRASSWFLRSVGGRFGSLLCSLIALLLSAPLIVEGWGWNLLLGLSASGVLVAGLQAARPGGRSLRIGLALAAADLAIGRLVFLEGARWLVVLQAALWLSTLVYGKRPVNSTLDSFGRPPLFARWPSGSHHSPSRRVLGGEPSVTEAAQRAFS